MTKAKRRHFWTALHRYLGLATLAFLFCAAVSGCLLCVDKPLDAALNPDLFHSAGAGARPPVLDLVVRFQAQRPDLRVTKLPLRVAAGRTIALSVAPARPGTALPYDQAFLDPQDGHLIGTRETRPGWGRRHIVEGIFQFHFTLLGGRWGRWLLGVCALGWLIGNVVGLYLTFPVTRPFWRKWGRSWRIDTAARLRWLLADLHRASGLWMLPLLVVLAATSVSMNFFDELFTPAVSAVSPARPSPFDRPAVAAPPGETGRIGFARAVREASRIAAARRLEWTPATAAFLPDRNLYAVAFTPSGYETYRWLGPVSYYVDGASGRFVYADDPYHDSSGRQLSRALYPLHSGQVIGPAGVAIIFLLGLATAEMCVTGGYIWWKKRRARRAITRAKTSARTPA